MKTIKQKASISTFVTRSGCGLLSLLLILCSSPFQTSSAVEPQQRDLYSDTWFAVDALDRATPTNAEVGDVKQDHKRVVSIFYITWHTQNLANLPHPYSNDVTRILNEAPEARLDANHPAWNGQDSFHWGEPETGYFLSQDEYVIRKDMSELVDAGVDVRDGDLQNHLAILEIQFVVALICENAATIDFRAGRAVENENRAGERVLKCGWHGG